jgi:hypothetical protein
MLHRRYYPRMLFRFFRYNDPGNEICNQPDPDREKSQHYPEDPDKVRIGIVILADPAAYSAKEPLVL